MGSKEATVTVSITVSVKESKTCSNLMKQSTTNLAINSQICRRHVCPPTTVGRGACATQVVAH
eukprot:2363411-Amphidinium_carterae.2